MQQTIVSDIVFTHIVHISDIHIRLSSRFDEYEYVLQTLLERLKKLKHAIVVITGDIFHHKNELTPDCVMFAVSFFRKITRLHPLVIIPGNHDFLMNNLDKNDSITSVLYRRNIKNVFYLKQSGVYRFGNLVFIHNSLWNPDQTEWIYPHTIQKEFDTDIMVSLYHGMVGKCQTLSGYTFESSETLSLSQFQGSDFVLLGDIHHHQFLQPITRYNHAVVTNKDSMIVAYAGSMIAQNFNETDENHGYILWNVVDKSAQFYILPNKYAYRRLDIYPQKDLFIYLGKSYDDLSEALDTMPSHVKLEIQIHDQDQYDTTTIRKQCHSKNIHPKIRYVHTPTSLMNQSNTNNSTSSRVYENNPLSLRNMFESYLQDHPTYTEQEMTTLIKEITQNVAAFQGNNDSSHNHHCSWKILEVQFDFLFGYGHDNKIVFEKDNDTHHGKHGLSKIVGIFGANSVGKSTLIDILMFMLYGRITRYACGNTIPPEIIHEKQDRFSASLRFQVGKDVYCMEKKGQRNKKTNKIKMTEELFQEMEDGKGRRSLTEEHRIKTDKIVRDLIGPMDQFQYLSLCTQIPSKPFREMTQKERKEFLFTLFRLDSFEEYHGLLNQQTKELEMEQKSLKLWGDSSSSNMTNDQEWKKHIRTLEREWKVSQEEVEELTEKKKELHSKFVHHTTLQSQVDRLRTDLKKRKIRAGEIEKELSRLNTLKKDEKGEEDIVDIDETEKALETCRKKLRKLRDESTHLRSKWRPLTKAPEYEDFSLRRWHFLRNKMKMTTSNPPPKTTMDHVSGTTDDDFSYFWRPRLRYLRTRLETMQKTQFPKIMETFQIMDNYSNRIKEAEAKTRHLQEEHKIHQSVKYNDSCHECQHNPFRQRKNEISTRLAKLETERKVCSQKIKYESGDVSRTIMELLRPIKEGVGLEMVYNGTTDWTKEMFTKHVEEIFTKIQKMEGQVEWFEKRMGMLFEEKASKVYESERTEYEKTRTYVEGLDSFLRVQWQNKLIERRELRLVEEITAQEEVARKYEYKITHYTKTLRKKQLEREQKDLWKVEKEEWEELKRLQTSLMEGEGVEKEFNDVADRITTMTKKETILERDLEDTKHKFKQWKDNVRKLEEVSEKIRTKKCLMKICDRNGFPLYILRTIVPTFNDYMNGILNHFIDRYVKFEIDKDGDVMFHTKSTDSEMNFHFYGGMESLMIDLATKITFSHFAYCPMSSFFVLDENISVLDEFHIQHIEILFGFLKQHFRHILLISHVPSMKNVVDTDVWITKEDGYSQINCIL